MGTELEVVWKRGYIKEVNKGYERKQAIMVQGLKELGWDFSRILVPRSTFYLWIPIPERYATSEEFAADLLKTSGIVIVPGSGFGRFGEGYVRISIVATEENLKKAIERMKKDGFYYNK